MDIRAYLDSGIIEEYCLGLLDAETASGVEQLSRQHPAIDLEIRQTLETLTRFSTVAQPRPQLKTALFKLIGELEAEQSIDIKSPPFIHRHSDVAAWNKAIEGLVPDFSEGTAQYHYLQESPDFQLSIVWLEDELVEDGHNPDDFSESFLILEGACECNIDGKIIHLQAGDYFEIPQLATHTIRNTSAYPQLYVKALVQRRKAA
ncbi:MAG: cupin domain-containing protein [Saprospiraceae bacterium]|nr:cupin domain-containing protein [Saprospiraceae bacterium]